MNNGLYRVSSGLIRLLITRINITTREYDRLGMTNNDDLIPKSAKQIFDEIRTIINNSNNNYLKAEIDKPYSIILKHLIISGIDGFQQGTSGMSLKHD